MCKPNRINVHSTVHDYIQYLLVTYSATVLLHTVLCTVGSSRILLGSETVGIRLELLL